ncbi:hypothetical protein GCM10010394_55440 [Streptomyces crystallinus]|uniref:Uncharacterized protein n=1 Tax=Streptomyces crystallinus TaxID=68191 RepID=A0ABP3RUP6_9ACTN
MLVAALYEQLRQQGGTEQRATIPYDSLLGAAFYESQGFLGERTDPSVDQEGDEGHQECDSEGARGQEASCPLTAVHEEGGGDGESCSDESDQPYGQENAKCHVVTCNLALDGPQSRCASDCISAVRASPTTVQGAGNRDPATRVGLRARGGMVQAQGGWGASRAPHPFYG